MADVMIDRMSEVLSEALHVGVIPRMDGLILSTAQRIDKHNPPVEELSKMGTQLWDVFCTEVASAIVAQAEAACADGAALTCPNCDGDLTSNGDGSWSCVCGYNEQR